MLLFAADIYGCLCKYDVVTCFKGYLSLNVISCALNIDVLPGLCPLFFNHVGAPVRSYICQCCYPTLEVEMSFHTDNENIYFQATLA